ncbi:hypothetical protein Nepgr_028323 [Nepenthes gracilis]|uniref:Uncharacterized protein n=1 Tax=Nepenthes gracilis TaxID=150966 RepID=A0AAD3TA41_NEPGR|nr:hypothetical protein Nepgr_028323 [Nepenthes gracilis]
MMPLGEAHEGADGNPLYVLLMWFTLPALELKMMRLDSVLEHTDIGPCGAPVKRPYRAILNLPTFPSLCFSNLARSRIGKPARSIPVQRRILAHQRAKKDENAFFFKKKRQKGKEHTGAEKSIAQYNLPESTAHPLVPEELFTQEDQSQQVSKERVQPTEPNLAGAAQKSAANYGYKKPHSPGQYSSFTKSANLQASKSPVQQQNPSLHPGTDISCHPALPGSSIRSRDWHQLQPICSRNNSHQQMASATNKAPYSKEPNFYTASSSTASECSNHQQSKLHHQGNEQQ